MHKFSFRLFLSPSDVGVEKYNVREISERMKPIEPLHGDNLLEFALAVHSLFNEAACHTKRCYVIQSTTRTQSLTRHSTRTPQKRGAG